MKSHITNEYLVQEYQKEMAEWISKNSENSYLDVVRLFEKNSEQLDRIFYPNPEVIFHDDPAKWGELLANSWGIIPEKELEFI